MKLGKGIKLALITAVISGVAIFVNKFAVGAITPPLVFTGTKNTLVAILVLSWLGVSGKWRLVWRLRRSEIWKLGLIGLIGGAVPFYLFFTGLAQIPAINGALIHKTLVLWVAVLAIPLLKEKLSALQVLGIVLLFGGNVAVGGFEGFKYSQGELMVLGATMLWAVENVIAKKVLKTVDADLVVTARMGLGSIILLGMAVWQYPDSVGAIHELPLQSWGWILLTAGTLLGYTMTWYRALKLAPAITVPSILVGSTLVTNVLSAIFVTHQWTWGMGAQAGVIGGGLVLFLGMRDIIGSVKENRLIK